MAWIRTCPPSPDNAALAEAFREGTAQYPPEYRPGSPAQTRVPEAVKKESIVLSHSLIPGALRHAFAAYAAMLDPALPLSRREHEMIAATVSVLNDCYY